MCQICTERFRRKEKDEKCFLGATTSFCFSDYSYTVSYTVLTLCNILKSLLFNMYTWYYYHLYIT